MVRGSRRSMQWDVRDDERHVAAFDQSTKLVVIGHNDERRQRQIDSVATESLMQAASLLWLH